MSLVLRLLSCIAFFLVSASHAHAYTLEEETCLPTWPHETGRAFLGDVTNGWRSLDEAYGPRKINEVRNVEVIYDEFIKAGHSPALALAAIVNAFEESALDNTAIMSSPFRWKNKYYPRGTRAVGLFQLLPSVSGAGGPSGIAEGYSRDFEERRYAGTAWQARQHGTEPDWRGRTYYNAQNPVLNTRRILMEIERDGARLLRAEKRGASIADLTVIFAKDIERPSVAVWPRRRRAAAMMGAEIVYARDPALHFPLERKLPVFLPDLGAESENPYRPPPSRPILQLSVRNASVPLALVMLGLLLLAGGYRSEELREPAKG